MKEIFIRLTNESPRFFKRIQALGITLGVIGTALLMQTIVVLPELINTAATYCALAGFVASAVAGMPVKDQSVLPKKDA